MELRFLSEDNQVAKFINGSDSIFGRVYNEALVHQIVIAYQANARCGNRAQKGRSNVNFSHRKPWRQKGTGNARAGTRSSPLWRSGGRIFPNLAEENFRQKINKKMFRASICTILSKLVYENRLYVIENLFIQEPKTKLIIKKLQSINLEKSVLEKSILIITDVISNNLHLACRNLSNILIINPYHINPLSLINYKQLLITKVAIAKIEEIFV